MSEIGRAELASFQIEKPKILSSTESGKKLAETLDKSKVEFELQKTGIEQMPEIFIVRQEENLNEKCVRIYRGIGKVETVLTQIPYAMRITDSKVVTQMDEHLEEIVEDLANNLTYEKLVDYVKTVSQEQNSKDKQRFGDDLKRIEDNMLENGDRTNIANELKFNTFGHTGGFTAEAGLSPYLSASLEMNEALGFIAKGGALMVIDIPISKLSFFKRESNGEVFINGKLDSKYIKAIIPKIKDIDSEEKESVLSKTELITENIKGNIYSKEELPMIIANYFDQSTEKEQEQNVIDLQLIKNKRGQRLIESFSYQIPNLKELVMDKNSTNIDLYSKTKSIIYDFFRNELEKIGENLDNLNYKQENFFGGPKKYDRDKIDDEMLLALSRLTNLKKDRYEEIMERRKERELWRKKV